MCLAPQSLDGVHDIALLSQESVTHSLGPVLFIAHHGKNLWKGDQRLHTEVPVHAIQGGIQFIALAVVVLPYPLVRFRHLVGVGGCHQDLPEQGIRIKSDWCKHLVQLFLSKGRTASGTLCKSPRRGRHQQNQEPRKNSQIKYFSVHNFSFATFWSIKS
jgi:hypothetical protein